MDVVNTSTNTYAAAFARFQEICTELSKKCLVQINARHQGASSTDVCMDFFWAVHDQFNGLNPLLPGLSPRFKKRLRHIYGDLTRHYQKMLGYRVGYGATTLEWCTAAVADSLKVAIRMAQRETALHSNEVAHPPAVRKLIISMSQALGALLEGKLVPAQLSTAFFWLRDSEDLFAGFDANLTAQLARHPELRQRLCELVQQSKREGRFAAYEMESVASLNQVLVRHGLDAVESSDFLYFFDGDNEEWTSESYGFTVV